MMFLKIKSVINRYFTLCTKVLSFNCAILIYTQLNALKIFCHPIQLQRSCAWQILKCHIFYPSATIHPTHVATIHPLTTLQLHMSITIHSPSLFWLSHVKLYMLHWVLNRHTLFVLAAAAAETPLFPIFLLLWMLHWALKPHSLQWVLKWFTHRDCWGMSLPSLLCLCTLLGQLRYHPHPQ